MRNCDHIARPPRGTTLAAVTALVLGVAACGEPQRVIESGTVGTNAQVGDVLLRNVHVRPPDGDAFRVGDDGLIVLALFNKADQPDELTDVRTPVAADVEILWDRECDGTAESVPTLPLAADGGVTGEGGNELAYRLRVLDFSQEVLAGTTVPVTFAFARAGETTVDAIVETTGDNDSSPPLSCGPPTSTTTPNEITLRGTVEAGVEPGCLVLNDRGHQYLLLGTPQAVRAGAEVVVEGTPAPGAPTTCQQGTPFHVTEVRPMR